MKNIDVKGSYDYLKKNKTVPIKKKRKKEMISKPSVQTLQQLPMGAKSHLALESEWQQMPCKAAEALATRAGGVSHRAFAWRALHRNSCTAPSFIFFRFLLNITLLEAFHDHSTEICPFNSFFLPSPLFYITLIMIWHLAVHLFSNTEAP